MERTDGCKWKRSRHCFRDCTDISDKEFQKIFELENAGIALYRYVAENQDPEQTVGDVYILRTDKDGEMEPDEFTTAFAKNKISCPRCIKLIEKAEKQLTGRPLIKQKDIMGICDHCWRPLARIQELSKKKQKVSAIEAVDALKAQMDQEKRIDKDETKELKELGERTTAPRTQAPRKDRKLEAKEKSPNAKETIDKKPEAKEKSLKAKETIDKKPEATKKTLKAKKAIDEKPEATEKTLKAKKAIDEKPEATEKTLKAKKTIDEKPEATEKTLKAKKAIDEKPEATEKTLKAKKAIDEKPEATEKTLKAKKTIDEKPEAKEKSLELQEAKLEKPEAKEKNLKAETSAGILKAQIAQEKLKREKEAENRRKQQEQENKMTELAEKRAREADLECEKLINAKSLPKLEVSVTDSEDDEAQEREHSSYEVPVINEIIIGETICKNSRIYRGDEDLDIIRKKSTQKLRNSGKASVMDTERHDKKPALASKSQKAVNVSVGGLEKHGNSSKKLPVNSVIGEKITLESALSVQRKTKPEDGTIRYSLSNRTFIDKGWTMLPLEKVVRKMNVYRMRPSKPEFNWFERNKNRVLAYDTGEMLAEVDEAGRGRWYYRSGALAMDYYDAEETNAGRRFVVYSSGAPDARGRPRPRTVLATFDHAGNGIVFDHTGKPRLKYNQTEGIVLDRGIGPASRWQWHTLNDPPVLQQVMVDTQVGFIDPDIASMGPEEQPRPEDEAMLSIELDNFVKERTKKSSQNFMPCQIRMKALKINENFSLRVLDQASVYLSFRDGSTNLKINIGMLLDHKEIVDTDISEIGEVSNRVERLPACTASMSDLQHSVARAHKRAAAERAARARLAGCPQGRLSGIDSVDALRAAVSRPPRTLVITCSASVTHDSPKLLKPCCCDLYCKSPS